MYDTMMLLTESGRQRRKRKAAARTRSALYVREIQYIGLESFGGVGVEGPFAPGGQKNAPPLAVGVAVRGAATRAGVGFAGRCAQAGSA